MESAGGVKKNTGKFVECFSLANFKTILFPAKLIYLKTASHSAFQTQSGTISHHHGHAGDS